MSRVLVKNDVHFDLFLHTKLSALHFCVLYCHFGAFQLQSSFIFIILKNGNQDIRSEQSNLGLERHEDE